VVKSRQLLEIQASIRDIFALDESEKGSRYGDEAINLAHLA
jgi:hypothetical protein